MSKVSTIIKRDGAEIVNSVLFFGVFIGLDQYTKWYAFKYFDEKVGNFIYLTKFENYNFAFGLELNPLVGNFFLLLALFVVLLYFAIKFESFDKFSRIIWIMILAGAVSNSVGRFTFGYVRDFIGIYHGVFNLADFFIILGVVGLIIQNYWGKKTND